MKLGKRLVSRLEIAVIGSAVCAVICGVTIRHALEASWRSDAAVGKAKTACGVVPDNFTWNASSRTYRFTCAGSLIVNNGTIDI